MNLTRLEVSSGLTGTLVGLRTNSYYDEESGERKIKKSKASYRKIGLEISQSKNTVNKDIIKLKDEKVIMEQDGGYIIKDAVGSKIDLPTEFVKNMNTTFHVDLLKTYLWLYREYSFAQQEHRDCLFSYKRIIEQAGNQTYNKDRIEKAKRHIAQLAGNGLIVVSVKRVKAEINGKGTFLLKLEVIRTNDIVSNIEKEMDKTLDTLSEYQGNVSSLHSSDYEDIGVTVGFQSIELPKVCGTGNKQISDYVSVEELSKKLNMSIDNLLSDSFIEFNEVNRDGVEYEKQRLNGID